MDNELMEYLADDELFKCLLNACSSNYTLKKIANDLEYGCSTLYNYLTGNQNLSKKRKAKIYQYLKVNNPSAFERARMYKRISEEMRSRDEKKALETINDDDEE